MVHYNYCFFCSIFNHDVNILEKGALKTDFVKIVAFTVLFQKNRTFNIDGT